MIERRCTSIAIPGTTRVWSRIALLTLCSFLFVVIAYGFPGRVGMARDDVAARTAFLEAYKVFMHPRCVNCHPVGDAPLRGEESQPHSGLRLRRGVDGQPFGASARLFGRTLLSRTDVPSNPTFMTTRLRGWMTPLQSRCISSTATRRSWAVPERWVRSRLCRRSQTQSSPPLASVIVRCRSVVTV
jgi:hypothetical protein